jgi:hypothetical protein
MKERSQEEAARNLQGRRRKEMTNETREARSRV